VRHALADGQHAQEVLGLRRQALDAQQQRLPHRRRQRAAAVVAGGQQLLGEQRVALRARPQAVQQVARRRVPEDVGELLRELRAGEGPQLDPAGARVALQLGQQRSQRVAAVQLVRAVGGDDQHALVAQGGGEVGEERARGAVRPVEVLDNQQQAGRGGEAVQQVEEGLEQPGARGRGLVRRLPGRRGAREAGEEGPQGLAGRQGEVFEHRVAAPGERAQGADQRGEGELALTEVDAVATDHAHPVRAGEALELGDQPGLADPRLAGHEGQRGGSAARGGEGAAELGELRVPAYEPRAGDPCRHRGSIPPPRDAGRPGPFAS